MNNNSSSKYEKLWNWIAANGTDQFFLSFSEIEHIAEVPMDHSFLRYKNDLQKYGFQVKKISMKEQKVSFEKLDQEP